MNLVATLALAFLAGLLLKIADELVDSGSRNELAKFLFAGLSAALLACLITLNPAFAVMGLSIVLGCVIAGKVDHPALQMGAVIILFTVLFYDLPAINYLFLAALVIAEFLDEKFNDLADKVKGSGLIHLFMEKRVFYEVVALVISLVTGNINFIAFILLFDLGYVWLGPKAAKFMTKSG